MGFSLRKTTASTSRRPAKTGGSRKASSKNLLVQVEVLQNGATVASVEKSLSRLKTLALTTGMTGELALPHYPLLNGHLDFLQADTASSVLLLVDSQWEGLCTSQGNPRTLQAGERHNREVALHKGDYASISRGDLRILVRVLPRKVKADKGLKGTDPAYRPFIWQAFINRPEEVWGLFAASLMTIGIASGIMLGFLSNHQTKPVSLVDINDEYALSFVAPEHLRSSPEALQSNIDRLEYTRSTIEFYQAFIAMLTGRTNYQSQYVFPTSAQQYQNLYQTVEDNIDEKLRRQKSIDDTQLASKSSSVLTIPTVIGESLEGQALRVLDKIDIMQQSFELNLKTRRYISATFPKDPIYDFEDYKNVKPNGKPAVKDEKFQAAMEDIAASIGGASDEVLLYTEAERLASKAAAKQRRLKTNNQGKKLEALQAAPLAMPEGVKYASFSRELDFSLADDKAYQIQASEFGATKTQIKPKEPLVGEIDPHLIEKYIKQNRFQLQLCYELALRRNEAASGMIEWRWRIDSRGSISDLALVSSGIKDTKLLNCLEKKIMGWRFPRPRKGSIEISYPFEFTPTKG